MELLYGLLDWLYYGVIAPFFRFLSQTLTLIFLKPLEMLGVPVGLQVALIAVLTAVLAFRIRSWLRVEEKVREFNERFAEKRKAQQDLQLISDWKSRDALYRATDEELNHEYNTFLAYHYARYVLVYLLPLFLILAWLNNYFSEPWLIARFGKPFVILLPDNRLGAQGLSVTFIFLLVYVVSLIIGFRIKKYRRS
ncbi:hypothetical protein GF1_10140 [Desulfolithobacter dissulfuricans]|uniref:Uncharacterized protein n=1 Tax=Desulfolithobacter dissulfuricans TaxID=2795293 RepID=A0A915XK20_9BACT|nr:hypothetical protein [Desulfolithobacter dissulfuricans]BCO08638.1 hypothetical protein GF1_10140 [Desulfolithobacter dissulfuricans]